jgi:hypothetical protein
VRRLGVRDVVERAVERDGSDIGRQTSCQTPALFSNSCVSRQRVTNSSGKAHRSRNCSMRIKVSKSQCSAPWINAPVRRHVEAVQNIEDFERGPAFKVTKRISEPPQIENFDRMQFSDEDVSDLQECRPGNREVKLGNAALQKLRSAVDWSAPIAKAAVNTAMRHIALDYVKGYLESGNERLAVIATVRSLRSWRRNSAR